MKSASDLVVGSLLVYPKGASSASARARAFIRFDVKQGKVRSIEAAMRRLVDVLPGSVLAPLLAEADALIPVPGHAPLAPGGLWVAALLCRALQAAGVGVEVRESLSRRVAVPRSSRIPNAIERPSPMQHRDSLDLESTLEFPERILLVDDVVTRGATLLGAAALIRERHPGTAISAFALARVADVDLSHTPEMLAPRVETIRFDEAAGLVERR